jgi:diphthamide biosynthesis protein 2
MSERKTPPQLMFDDGSRVMMHASEAPAAVQQVSPRGNRSVEEYYEIGRLSQEILDVVNGTPRDSDGWACRVALQFPDALLPDAPEVCWAMEQALMVTSDQPALVFVLGDTTFGSCCPDEVAALHLTADVLVHYGHACLSPAQQLPVLYSFGITDMDVPACVEAIVAEANKESVRKILLLYEVRYHHAMAHVQTLMSEQGDMLVLAGQIPQPCCGGEAMEQSEETAGPSYIVVGGLQIPSDVDLSMYTLVFVGDAASSSRQYVNTMLRFLTYPNGPTSFWTYSPTAASLETSLPPNLRRQLNRRFFLTQKARDATCFGILVGTLSQKHFTSVVASLRHVIQDAGKASYTFAVGKVNAAKLANFAEIDCYVLVACGENSLLEDERDLHVPVITPLELDMALGNTEWGVYSLDYNDFLNIHANRQGQVASIDADGDEDADAPYFSLATGKYMDTKKNTGDIDLQALPGKGQVIVHQSKASEFLRSRDFQGLEAAIGETAVHAAKPGDIGIASNYGQR